jgi:hypothetical protein
MFCVNGFAGMSMGTRESHAILNGDGMCFKLANSARAMVCGFFVSTFSL